MSACSPLSQIEESSDAELVAFVLAGRSKDVSLASTDAASDLLARCAGLADLARTDVAELSASLAGSHVPRADRAARALAAAFELGRRVSVAERDTPDRFVGSSADAAAWAMPRIGRLAHEELWLLAIDGRCRLRAARCVARGGLHGAAVRAVDPLRFALRTGATGFVLVHNHPSGDPTPSEQDLVFTREVARGAAAVGVPLLDHVVVTGDGFVSVPLEGGAA
jgi:DNA repair protein RadC